MGLGGKEEVVEGVKGKGREMERRRGEGRESKAKKSVMCYFSVEFSKSHHITTF